jgi:hypothetical protein
VPLPLSSTVTVTVAYTVVAAGHSPLGPGAGFDAGIGAGIGVGTTVGQVVYVDAVSQVL